MISGSSRSLRSLRQRRLPLHLRRQAAQHRERAQCARDRQLVRRLTLEEIEAARPCASRSSPRARRHRGIARPPHDRRRPPRRTLPHPQRPRPARSGQAKGPRENRGGLSRETPSPSERVMERSSIGRGSVFADTDFPHPPSLSRRRLLPQGEKGSERIARTAPCLPAHYSLASSHYPHLPAPYARAPTRLEPIVVEHPRLCVHRTATFHRDDGDRRRRLALAARARCGPPQQGFRDHGLAGVPAFRPSIRRQDQCPCAFDAEAPHSFISRWPARSACQSERAQQSNGERHGRICMFIGHFPCG